MRARSSGALARSGKRRRHGLQADDGPRTRDLRLGKPMLYQLSYVRAPSDRANIKDFRSVSFQTASYRVLLQTPRAERRYSLIEILSIKTGSTGASRPSVSLLSILSTVSMPEVTWPNTVCLPSSHPAAGIVTMKNCEPLVLGPALAIASAPRTTLCWLNSSSNV